MEISCSRTNPPITGLLVLEHLRATKQLNLRVVWAEVNSVKEGNNTVPFSTGNDLARLLARFYGEGVLNGVDALEKTEVDHWLSLAISLTTPKSEHKALITNALQSVNQVLSASTFLVGKRITIADYAVFSALYCLKSWQDFVNQKNAPVHVLRWYNFIAASNVACSLLPNLPEDVKKALTPSSNVPVSDKVGNRAREGKFVELPGAEMGKVIVRFPPEASGYLHIGHAKAALLNQYYQEAFQGKLVFRFDDTNPAKESAEFEQVILEDVALLELKPDFFTHTSQYFDLMMSYCEKLLKENKAYVDDTDPETMKAQREQKVESANRNSDLKKNWALWEEMKRGSELGQKCCVRAKIDMQSANGCLRDPTIYRCKNEPHPRTGTKYRVYPTYDFACPIVDSIEGVTHVLRTMEYHDRDPQFFWFIDNLELRKPHIWEYSRLSMTNTVLSKRKLTWFVQEGLVDGWDDPRMPTVRGVLRRGMTVQGLKEFIIAQGSSRSVVFMEWDKIWAFNKKVIDPIAPRYTALEGENPVLVKVSAVEEKTINAPLHPKNDVGTKNVWIGPEVLIDRADVDSLTEGENATFINWGNLLIKKIHRKGNAVDYIEAVPNLDNKDYKKTPKLTWLARTESAKFTPTTCVYFDHLISKALLGKDEDFKQFVNRNTKKEVSMLGDPELKQLKQGDIIQLQRRGFFRVDVAYGERSLFSGVEQPIVLFYIPDGHTKDVGFGVAGKNVNATQTECRVENKVTEVKKAEPSAKTPSSINEEITAQGNKVRDLKTAKSPKEQVDEAVKVLLALKSEYKALTKTDWKPGCVPPTVAKSELPKIEVKKVESSAKTPSSVNEEIIAQGNKVRDLKTAKAPKEQIDEAVKVLLVLKSEYKSLTKTDWKPGCVPPTVGNTENTSHLPKTEVKKVEQSAKTPSSVNEEIIAQGNKVRDLKTAKGPKEQIDEAVKLLLALKTEYKALTKTDWKPGCVPPTVENRSQPPKIEMIKAESSGKTPSSINEEIIAQGNKVRDLKTAKGPKEQIDAAVKVLLALKTEYKALTKTDWKPSCTPPEMLPPPTVGNTENNPQLSKGSEELDKKIQQQGDKIRQMKAAKGDKTALDPEIKLLLALKNEYKEQFGKDWVVASGAGDARAKQAKEKKPAAPAKTAAPAKQAAQPEDGAAKRTRLGLEARKEIHLSDWYSQVIIKSEMIEYYDVSGCYIFRPWSYAIWESIKEWLDTEIKKLGVENCYFPIFVSRAVLEKEQTHIADFSPEVAWVTKSGSSDMAEPIAIRPTSETVMYPAYAKWIQSYRDLPIKLNQWNNVVRWEFKHPSPFLRTREFLWQEGHTAYASKEEADVEVKTILDLYAQIYTDILAIPVVKGRKTEKEKFAGGDYTLTVEAFISASGRAIQGATSHHLGQNFSKIFDIVYEDPDTQEKKHVFQNSWGLTTRTIGVMIMIHADNQGLVLPPRVASVQAVIVPCGITVNLPETSRKELQKSCDDLEAELRQSGVKVKGDYRGNYSPGWKFNHWELKGVPIRIELGPKDLEKGTFVAVRRDTGEKLTVPRSAAAKTIGDLLDSIQSNLLTKATQDLSSHTVLLKDWKSFTPNLDSKNIILAPFCGDMECEGRIKNDSTRDGDDSNELGAASMGAKSLCIPLEQPDKITAADKCIHPDCAKKPLYYTLFGRSY